MICLVLSLTSLHGQILFQDDFSKPYLFGESFLAYYQHGAYHIFADKGRMVYDDDHLVADFIAEVRTEYLDGQDNQGYGLFFRASDFKNCYVFTISANGYFELGGYKNGNWFDIHKWEKTDVIRKSGVNYMRIESKRDVHKLYINGQLIKTARDATFLNGYIGMVAYEKAHIHFDDFGVYNPGTKIENRFNFEPDSIETSNDYAADPEALFIDNFSNKSKNWSDAEAVYYEKGFYTVYNGEKGHFAWQGVNQTNYIYEAHLRVDKWTKNGSAGITVRMDGVDNYYGFFITEDKHYFFERNVNGVTKNLILKTPFEFDIHVAQTLRIECRDNEFKLFLNGKELATAVDHDNFLPANEKFGLFASKDVRADFLSIKISPVPFSWLTAVSGIATSWCTWISVITIGFIVFGIRRSRKKKNAEIRKKRETEIFDMIKSSQGSLGLGDVMFRYKITKKNAQSMLENIAQEYGGAAVLNPDGSVVYEFPDFMPSEDKIRRDVVAFAAKKKGRITVTETANYLKMDLVETEVLLDAMVDGKRVKKSEQAGIGYYEFVEIIAGLRN